jgi:hypothetical protein
MDYGRPIKPFSSKSQTFGLGQTIWVDKFWGIWGTVSPLSMFSINQPLFLQKKSLYIQIPNIYLGLGFEFGLQRIRDLTIVCPLSVLITMIAKLDIHSCFIVMDFWVHLAAEKVQFCQSS